MDNFFKEIYVLIFKKWIMNDHLSNICVVCNDYVETLIIETQYGKAEVSFNPMNIIELSVFNYMNNQNEFYLHFQLISLKHAIELYQEMMKCLNDLEKESILKVLFVCSGGMTTSFFAGKLNEAAKLLNLKIEADATAYYKLYELAEHYDVILLAPQISYMHPRVQGTLKKQTVIKIPPQTFAKYDVKELIELINMPISKKEIDVNDTRQPFILNQSNNKRILVW